MPLQRLRDQVARRKTQKNEGTGGNMSGTKHLLALSCQCGSIVFIFTMINWQQLRSPTSVPITTKYDFHDDLQKNKKISRNNKKNFMVI